MSRPTGSSTFSRLSPREFELQENEEADHTDKGLVGTMCSFLTSMSHLDAECGDSASSTPRMMLAPVSTNGRNFGAASHLQPRRNSSASSGGKKGGGKHSKGKDRKASKDSLQHADSDMLVAAPWACPGPMVFGAPGQPTVYYADPRFDLAEVSKVREQYDDEEDLRKEDCKQRIINGDSHQGPPSTVTELMNKAFHEIEDDWLGEELPGSMYRVMAFGGVFPEGVRFPQKRWSLAFMKLVFCVFVIIIQLVAPPYIFFSNIYDWEKDGSMNFFLIIAPERWHPTVFEWRIMPFTKLLQFIFVTVFLLNALWVLMDDHTAFHELDHLWDYLDRLTEIEFHGQWWLWVGSLLHCWLVTWCVLAHFLLIGSCTDAKDIVFDSLGMLFLYNLDDIGGDLGFLDEDDWRGRECKWMYEEMVKTQWPGDRDIDHERQIHPMVRFLNMLFSLVTGLVIILLFLLPLLQIITPWQEIFQRHPSE